MGDEVATFQEQVDVIRRAALGVVCSSHEGCIFGSTPIQFRCDNAAEFRDGILDLGVDLLPFGRWIGLLLARIGECVQVIIVGWGDGLGWENNAVGTEVFNERSSQ